MAEQMEDTEKAQGGTEQGGGGNSALKSAAAAALAAAAAGMIARKALSSGGSNGANGSNGSSGSQGRNGGSKSGGSRSSDSGSMLGSIASGGWDAARDALLPAAEDAAGAIGSFVALNGPEIVRERIVPRFIESFNEARGD